MPHYPEVKCSEQLHFGERTAGMAAARGADHLHYVETHAQGNALELVY